MGMYRLTSTTDSWATINVPGVITPGAKAIAPWAGDDTDNILVEIEIVGGGVQNHVIGTMYGEADITATGIAGTNCGVGPGYVDSIPNTCGGTAWMGIQAVDERFYPPGTRGPNPYRESTRGHHQQQGISIYAESPIWRA